EPAARREFGRAGLLIEKQSPLLAGVSAGSTVWMSHGDHLTRLPDGYEVIARTSNAPIAAVQATDRPHYGVQFHPEVVHTENGHRILENFAIRVCGASADWTAASFVEEKVSE